MLNQLLSGHTLLKQHRARIDNSVSEICPVCSVREDPDHFLLYSKSYETLSHGVTRQRRSLSPVYNAVTSPTLYKAEAEAEVMKRRQSTW